MTQASFSRTAFPNGGWIYTQPQIGWSNPSPMGTTFDGTVTKMLEVRRKNPAMCLRHKIGMDRASCERDLENFTRLRLGIPMPTPPAPTTAIGGFSSPILSNIMDIKKLAIGAGLLMEWNSSGAGKVSETESNARAKVCAECRLNSLPNYEHWLKVPVAGSLTARTEQLKALKLVTSHDAKLGLCGAIFCPTSYLVHAPRPILDKRIGPKVRPNLDAKCWILQP